MNIATSIYEDKTCVDIAQINDNTKYFVKICSNPFCCSFKSLELATILAANELCILTEIASNLRLKIVIRNIDKMISINDVPMVHTSTK